MNKTLLLMMSLCLLSYGCGQKSTIKNHVESERLADAYGDGKHVIKSLTFPLTDSSLAYKTPLPGLGPIAGGLLKFVGDIFAKNTNMGKMQMSYTQPIPVIPTDYLNSIRLKRFFFYMKPPAEGRRIRDWFSRVLLGRGHVTFDFLDKFAVRMASTSVEDPAHYVPTLLNSDYNRREASTLMEVFDASFKFNVVDADKAREIVLLKYDDDTKDRDTRSNDYGDIHILETTEDPKDIKYFLMDQSSLKGLYKRILILDKSILVELSKDPIAEETFKKVLSDNAELIEDLGVNFIDTCTPRSCLELAVPDVNLVPIANKGNALKLDAIIHAAKVPETFKLKGFVEFEIKLDLPI